VTIGSRKSAKYLRGATRVLDWLQRYPGAGWQQQWDAANGDDKTWMDLLASQDWRLEKTIRDELFTGFAVRDVHAAFRPRYDFFHGNHLAGFFDGVQRNLDPELFASLDHTGHELGMSGKQINDGKKTLVRLVLHTGADLEGVTERDFFELRDFLFATWSADYTRCKPGLGSSATAWSWSTLSAECMYAAGRRRSISTCGSVR
jgi:hypothetical protein